MKSPVVRFVGLLLAVSLACIHPLALYLSPLHPLTAYASGFIDFESGIDGQPIKSTIPGLEFITTNGQDWIYADWRAGTYNGKYPGGNYTSNGNFFAWLGPNQGDGRINFIKGGATYLSFSISTANSVTLRGYAANGALLAQKTFSGGNLNTGFMNELRIDTTSDRKFSYAIVSGQANYWLIDDLSTDAEGVPNMRTPLIFIPGIMGSKLNNHKGEVWPNATELTVDPDDDSLLVLRLQADGVTPLEPENQDYSTVTLGDVISRAGGDVYETALAYLDTRGYRIADKTLYLFPYDWRKDNQSNSALLAQVVDQIKTETGLDKVNILAHSMGGLVARLYISDPAHASNIDTLVTLGTPYLGAPKAFDVLHYGHACMIQWGVCLLNRNTTQQLVKNWPGAYQLLPGPHYHQVYPNGHLLMDRDTTGDGQNEGWLSYTAIKQIITDQHNPQAFNKAELMFDRVESYANGTNGVKVYAFVGMQQGTPGSVREYQKRPWNGLGAPKTVYDFVPINGDGTVPLHSADLGRAQPHDFSGAVSYFYAPLEHGELAKFEEVGQAVFELVANILEVDAPTNLQYQPASPKATTETGHDNTTSATVRRSDKGTAHAGVLMPSPITQEPIPLSGYQILVQGSTLLQVEDTSGNSSQLTADEILTSNIPGSTIYRLGDSTSVFVPAGQRYQIKLIGQADDTADLKLRVVNNDLVSQTVVYEGIPINIDSTAAVTFTTDSRNPLALAIDLNADGVTDMHQLPDARLDAQQSTDVIPPTSTISVTYLADNTQAVITLNATDDQAGSGILRIEYSTDGGLTGQVYTGPFAVSLTAVEKLQAKAIDRAGNEQFPWSETVVSYRLYLPLTAR